MSPRYNYACKCGSVVEEVRGYEEDSIPCSSCSERAQRVAVYAEQFIIGETCPKGIATRAGNIKDSKGRTRVSLFQEASEEMNYAHVKAENEQGRKLKSPNLYKAGVARARQMGAPIRG
jgi:hypothetical protein